MEIYGRTVGFKRTVGATCDISEMAPDGDLNRLDAELLQSSSLKTSQETAAKIIVALSKGYETSAKFADPSHESRPLTVEELFSLPEETFQGLFREAMEAWTGEKITIETEELPPEKGKKKDELKK